MKKIKKIAFFSKNLQNRAKYTIEVGIILGRIWGSFSYCCFITQIRPILLFDKFITNNISNCLK